MAKYTKEQLREMADEVICAYNLMDRRADMLLMILAQHFNVTPEMVLERIRSIE